MADETTTPQSPDTDDIVAVIDPKNEVAIRALLAFKRRIVQLEEAHVVRQALVDDHERRLEAVETMLGLSHHRAKEN